jgi:hypothetical protein
VCSFVTGIGDDFAMGATYRYAWFGVRTFQTNRTAEKIPNNPTKPTNNFSGFSWQKNAALTAACVMYGGGCLSGFSVFAISILKILGPFRR